MGEVRKIVNQFQLSAMMRVFNLILKALKLRFKISDSGVARTKNSAWKLKNVKLKDLSERMSRIEFPQLDNFFPS